MTTPELLAKTPREVAKNTLSSGPIGHICYIQKHPKAAEKGNENPWNTQGKR